MRYPIDPIKRQKAIVSGAEIEEAFKDTNFGPHANFRSIVNEAVWKVSCGYSNGATAEGCLISLGLASRRKNRKLYLLKKGREYQRCCTMPMVSFLSPLTAPHGEEG